MDISKKLWAAKEWARVKAGGDEFVTLVHEATNEDKWGPTGKQMEDVCRAFPRGATEIMDEIVRRLKHRDKLWRSCYKALLLLDYLARNLSDSYLPEICALVPLLRTISQSFYYTSGKGIDHGISVRERAKNLADLLSDGLLLRQEREKSAQTKAKLAQNMPNGNTLRMYGGGRYEESYGGQSRPYSTGGRGGYTGYDPCRDNFNRSPQVLRTKSEQELFDLQMAMRLQREEERLSGMSASQIEKMYYKGNPNFQSEGPSNQGQSYSKDYELACRLQEEEHRKAESQETSLRDVDTKPAPPAAATASKPTDKPGPTNPAPPAVNQSNILDDLFAPSTASSAAPQGVDGLFGAFPSEGSSPQGMTGGAAPPANAWGQGGAGTPWETSAARANVWGPPQGGAPPSNYAGGPPPTASAPANVWGPPQGGVPPSNYAGGPPPTASAPQLSAWQSLSTTLPSAGESGLQWVQAPMPVQPQPPLDASTSAPQEARGSGNMPTFPSF
ncbi:unnamed protein product [Phytomonas sp. EM1]|nr:unnamed protein product [Phytomonas sp. EM1]|eukprot:CCW63423.1 unnamed protein product [Phytomonas sp. isolate EM1]